LVWKFVDINVLILKQTSFAPTPCKWIVQTIYFDMHYIILY